MKIYFPNAKIINTLNFWISQEDMQQFIRKKRYNFNKFYTFQKQKFSKILKNSTDFDILESKSQDKLNRNKIQKSQVPKQLLFNLKQDKINTRSIKYVKKYFKSNYGDLRDQIIFPINHKQSIQWLRDFFKNKLIYFGKYQDSIDVDNPFLYHSVISPMLNIGSLTDQIVISELIYFLYKYDHLISLQSLEAFLRQIIGWRNYVYMIYTLENINMGFKVPQTTKMTFTTANNQLNHKNTLTEPFWSGNTGISVIDDHIKQLNQYAYLSHIPRLMILGNFMLLLNLNPQDVFKWFSTMFIDSSDVLMVPNIMMSQYYSSIMMTRFYISSFNYIGKMSNKQYQKQDKAIWDILFKNFLLTHEDLCMSSYVYSNSVKQLLKLPSKQQTSIKSEAQKIIQKFTNKVYNIT